MVYCSFLSITNMIQDPPVNAWSHRPYSLSGLCFINTHLPVRKSIYKLGPVGDSQQLLWNGSITSIGWIKNYVNVISLTIYARIFLYTSHLSYVGRWSRALHWIEYGEILGLHWQCQLQDEVPSTAKSMQHHEAFPTLTPSNSFRWWIMQWILFWKELYS